MQWAWDTDEFTFPHALSRAPASLTRFGSSDGLPQHVIDAVPATVTHLAFSLGRGDALRGVPARWFDPSTSGTDGRLQKVRVVGYDSEALVREYPTTKELLGQARRAGCEVECR